MLVGFVARSSERPERVRQHLRPPRIRPEPGDDAVHDAPHAEISEHQRIRGGAVHEPLEEPAKAIPFVRASTTEFLGKVGTSLPVGGAGLLELLVGLECSHRITERRTDDGERRQDQCELSQRPPRTGSQAAR